MKVVGEGGDQRCTVSSGKVPVRNTDDEHYHDHDDDHDDHDHDDCDHLGAVRVTRPTNIFTTRPEHQDVIDDDGEDGDDDVVNNDDSC